MIVDDLDTLRTCLAPHETDPPLRVDPDVPLTVAITTECFEPVPRRKSKIRQHHGRIDRNQLGCCRSLESPPLRRTLSGREEPFGPSVAETLNHFSICHTYGVSKSSLNHTFSNTAFTSGGVSKSSGMPHRPTRLNQRPSAGLAVMTPNGTERMYPAVSGRLHQSTLGAIR